MGDDRGMVPVDEADDLGSGMSAADAEVAELPCVSQGDAACWVHDVVSDLPDIGSVWGRGCGFRYQLVGRLGCLPADGSVWSGLVVERAEFVEGASEVLDALSLENL